MNMNYYPYTQKSDVLRKDADLSFRKPKLLSEYEKLFMN